MCIRYLNFRKELLGVMSCVGPRSSCRSLFRKLNILPIACQYVHVLSLMQFIVDNKTFSLMHMYMV